MQFRQGVRVFTAGDTNVGVVDRVVLDPQTKEATHIVVRKGFLFTEDKVVPISYISDATEDRVTLQDTAGDLQALPHFEEKHYVPLTDEEIRADYSPNLAQPYVMHSDVGRSPMRVEIERNIPEDSVALREGTHVISADEKHVGNIERIIIDQGDNHVSHFVIAQGLLFKERKLIPMTWVSKVEDDEIRLAVNSLLLEKLEPYDVTVQV